MSAVVTPTRCGPLARTARAVERTYLRVAIRYGEWKLQRMRARYHLVSVAQHRRRALEAMRVRLSLLEAA
jgi:hypothetical protein